MKPSAMPSSNSTQPIIQLASRGRRNAPVKKMRSMCTVMDTMNMSAAQWCIWRIKSPPRTSKDRFKAVSYARDISTPFSGRYAPS